MKAVSMITFYFLYLFLKCFIQLVPSSDSQSQRVCMIVHRHLTHCDQDMAYRLGVICKYIPVAADDYVSEVIGGGGLEMRVLVT